MRIYFLRHGLAEDRSPKKPDAERVLTKEGIRKIELSVKKFAALDIHPSAIYTSPLVRAYQTAEIVAKNLKCPLYTRELLAPGFDPDKLQKLLEDFTEDELMVVGHEPDFSYTVSKVIGGGSIIMKKGGLARVDFQTKSLLKGSLVWLLTPRLLTS
jgi:phosphohistidine phosphatase